MKLRGFTLIELAIVLAIIAVLAAMLVPVVTQYVDEARSTRALAETRIIATAIMLHQRDTSKFPVYESFTAPSTDVAILLGSGIQPPFSGVGWSPGFTPSALLQTRLNTNFFSLPTTPGTGRVAYHGPYLVNVDPDPWGRRYIAEVGTAPGSTYASFVVSAGPDGIIQTARLQPAATFAPSGDDIAARIK